MTRKEFLFEKYEERKNRYFKKHTAFYTNPSIARMDPFLIADGLYYVGDRYVCIHLIQTEEGLILIDSGFFGAAHLLVDSIWRAGFDPRDVRWIIHTHGHSDHFGASEEFRRMYGTKLAISKVDAQKLGKCEKYEIGGFPFAKIPSFDYEIEDGEIFKLGSKKIRCVLTPGHTEGVLSLFFDVSYDGNTYLAGLFGGAGVNAISLPAMYCNNSPMDSPQIMLSSIEKVWNEPVTIHLGNHPDNNDTLEKRERQLKEGGNPFIDSCSWHNFLSSLRKKVENKIEENEELEKEMKNLCVEEA
jgi:metallo-beta-lactamase class B